MPWISAIGAGAAVGDYDADGLDDIFVVDSRVGETCALYHNNGDRTFTDVSAASGLADCNPPQTMATGALWLDYDNDDHLDLYVMRFGRSLLYKGDGKGGFQDVSAASGLADKHQNIAAGITFDFDSDGLLDIFVAGYFADRFNLFELDTTKIMHDDFEAARNGGTATLYRNKGNGTFEDVTQRAGLVDTGWSLALGHGDIDRDGFQDVYIANDFGADKVFRNRGDGTFEDVTAAAIGTDTKKGMCAEFGDFNNDGFPDIYVTNITSDYLRECNMLWSNNGDGTFTDVALETETCDTGWGWGAKFFDFDNDGWLDLFAVCGFLSQRMGTEYWLDLANLAIDPERDPSDAMSWPAIGDKSLSGYQKSRLFHNRGDGTFDEIAERAGTADDRDGRGVALADFDNDGRLDLYVTNLNQPAILYRNRMEATGNWVQLSLRGTRSNRNAIGARVEVKTASGVQMREVNGGNGYSAQSTLRVHFGLGANDSIESIQVRWPSGLRQTLRNPPINRLLTIVETNAVFDR